MIVHNIEYDEERVERVKYFAKTTYYRADCNCLGCDVTRNFLILNDIFHKFSKILGTSYELLQKRSD